MFNPWESTFVDAEVEQVRHGDSLLPTAPLFQWAAAQRVNADKQLVLDGNGFAVLGCIRTCVTHGLIAPEWLAYAFNKRYDAVLNCRALSWDDAKAFGPPYKKGSHKNALRKNRLLKFAVWNKAKEILLANPDTPIDAYFFEQVGAAVRPRVEKTEAGRLYYLAKKLLESTQ